jgi:hypothetical protein
MEEALECVRFISGNFLNGFALNQILTHLVKQGKVDKAVECANSIKEEHNKSVALSKISAELAKQGKIKEALACTHRISKEYYKASALKCISAELAKQENWSLAEEVCLEISKIEWRYDCWKEIALEIKEQYDWQTALDKAQKLQNQEARLLYLKGWADYLPTNEMNIACLKLAIPNLASDTQSIENLLQKYALHEIMFCSPTQQLMERLNKSLYVQWAIDIKNQFPN